MPEKRPRDNKEIVSFGAYKTRDGWQVVKVTSHTNGRCKHEKIGYPEPRSIALELCRKEQFVHWFF